MDPKFLKYYNQELDFIRRMGGAALDLCSVACGRVDAYYEVGLSPWDLCAGSVIASEAGAIVEGHDVGGTDNLVIAAPSQLFGPLSDLLATAGIANV